MTSYLRVKKSLGFQLNLTYGDSVTRKFGVCHPKNLERLCLYL